MQDPASHVGDAAGAGDPTVSFSLWPTPWRKVQSGHLLIGNTLPSSYYAFAWRLAGGDQIWLCALGGLIAVLNTAPIEIQRRVVDRSLKGGDFKSLATFVIAYVLVIFGQGLLKLLFNVYRSWIAEHATQFLRSFLNRRNEHQQSASDPTPKKQGTEISMVIAESEPIGAFMGESISEAFLQAGIMASVMGYLLFLQPVMSIVIAAVFIPQLIFVPLMQRAIAARAQTRIKTLRGASAALVGEDDGRQRREEQDERFAKVFRLNIGVFKLKFTMNFLMNLCHQLGIAGVLGIGGLFVVTGKTQVGTIVAFVSGLSTIKDPWDDLITWFQTMTVTIARYKTLIDVLDKERTTENRDKRLTL